LQRTSRCGAHRSVRSSVETAWTTSKATLLLGHQSPSFVHAWLVFPSSRVRLDRQLRCFSKLHSESRIPAVSDGSDFSKKPKDRLPFSFIMIHSSIHTIARQICACFSCVTPARSPAVAQRLRRWPVGTATILIASAFRNGNSCGASVFVCMHVRFSRPLIRTVYNPDTETVFHFSLDNFSSCGWTDFFPRMAGPQRGPTAGGVYDRHFCFLVHVIG